MVRGRDRLRHVGHGRLDRIRRRRVAASRSTAPSRCGCNFFDTAWAYGERPQRAAARRGAARASRHAPLRRHQDPAEEPASGRARPSIRSTTSSPPITSASTPRRASRNLGVADDRSPAVPRLERRVGGRRRLAARGRRPEAREAGPRVRHQRQPLGADQRAARARDRPRSTAVQVVYNIFDQAPEDELFPVLPGARHRGHRARAVRRRQPHRHADARTRRWPEGDWRNLYFTPSNLAATLERVDRLRPLVPAGMTCRSWRCASSSASGGQHDDSGHAAAARTSSGTWRPATASRCRRAHRGLRATAGTGMAVPESPRAAGPRA